MTVAPPPPLSGIPDPNVEQRRAADPEASVWVAASAGSGKTKVLTDRVLALLLNGTRPERILCITFTKAAAAEMENRLTKRLGKWATMEEDKLQDELYNLTAKRPDRDMTRTARRLFAEVLDTPGGLKIQTVHSFCQSLLARFPIEADVPPHFEVLEDRNAAEMMLAARDAVLAAAEANGDLANALAAVSRRVQEDRLMDLFRKLASERGRLRRLFEAEGSLENVIARLYDRLDAEPGVSEEDVIRDACMIDTPTKIALSQAADALMKAETKKAPEYGKAIAAWIAGGTETRIATFKAYEAVFITGDGTPRKNIAPKAVLEADPGVEAALDREAQRLLDSANRVRRQVTAASTAGLLHLGHAMLDAYRMTKDAVARLDYDDLILKARDLLRRPGISPWVLYKLDGGIEHILIDEAQDTNPEQWEVIERLAEDFFTGQGQHETVRTVFAVGDVKQSIYSFQRADPEEFRRMRRHFSEKVRLAEAQWRDVPLAVSFRSTDAVLAAVDAVFAVPGAADGLTLGDEDIRHHPYRQGMSGRVELWPLVEPEEDEKPDPWQLPLAQSGQSSPSGRLAELIAARIAGWIGREVLPARNRTVRAGDIMVLLRRRTGFVDQLVRALKKRNVPVAGVDRMILTDQIAAMDLVALGQFLLMPEDDLTLATVLKGPFIGLDDDDLFHIARSGEEDGNSRKSTLWTKLGEYARTEEKDSGRRRAALAREWLSALLASVDTVRPFELYASVLTSPCPAGEIAGLPGAPLNGRQAIAARLGTEAEDPVEEFMGLTLSFEQGNIPSLEAFLYWFNMGTSEVKRDLEAAGRNEVRIMTVHGAKGLQAPIVIMPDTVATPSASLDLPLYWVDGVEGAAAHPGLDSGPHSPLDSARERPRLLVWTPSRAFEEKVAEAARLAMSEGSAREYRRLLYVAMTRAEDRLYVCGYAGKSAPSEKCWYSLVRAGMEGIAATVPFDSTDEIPEGWTGETLILETPQKADPKPDSEPEESVRAADNLPEWVRAPAPEEPSPSRPLLPSRPVTGEPSVRSPLGEDGRLHFKRGIIVHRLLQSLPDIAEDAREDAARRYLTQPALEIAAEEIEALTAEVMAVMDAPALSGIFGPGSRAEVPIVGLGPLGEDGKPVVVSGQIDRLRVTEEEVLIVDYKTLRPAPAEVDRVPEAYVRQMAVYRAVLKRIFPERPVRAALVFTDGPVVVELPDALLDRVAPAP